VDFGKWACIQSTGISNNYRNLVSTGIEVSSGDFDFMGDFILANGDQNTAWGMNLLGRYWLLEDALRFVGRYSYADTDDVGGLLVGFGLPGAEGDATQALLGYDSSRIKSGDEYHSFYGGLDWHIFDDYLMLSTGLEYRLLKDEGTGEEGSEENEFSGLFWQTSGRVAF